MRHKSVILFAVLIVGLCSCNRTKPQSPSNKYVADNTEQVSLILLNQRLAEQADEQIHKYLNNQPNTNDFSVLESGVWMIVRPIAADRRLKNNDEADISITFADINNDKQILLDLSQHVRVGKCDIVAAIDDAMRLMQHGDSTTLIIPWYQAYGTTGTKQVAAYTNLRAELKIK